MESSYFNALVMKFRKVILNLRRTKHLTDSVKITTDSPFHVNNEGHERYPQQTGDGIEMWL